MYIIHAQIYILLKYINTLSHLSLLETRIGSGPKPIDFIAFGNWTLGLTPNLDWTQSWNRWHFCSLGLDSGYGWLQP